MPVFSQVRVGAMGRRTGGVVPSQKRRLGWWIALAVLIGCLGIGAVLGVYGSAIYWPRTPSGTAKKVTIAPGMSLADVTKQLASLGYIRHPLFFEIYTRISGTASKVQAGDFSIPEHISGKDLAALLGVAEVDQVSLRFQEGWRMEEMAVYLDERKVAALSGNAVLAIAQHPSAKLKSALHISLPDNASLEGFLFPDTYLVERDTTPEQLVQTMVSTYRRKVTPDLQAGFAKQGLDEYAAVTLASIVEREGRSAADRAIIAGILLKRLQNGTPLYVDATLQYGLGYSATEGRWWRQTLTVDDLAMDSPFNTRLRAGLPPQPICNPSLQALEAVAKPTTTPYFYYMHDNQGIPHYATTLAEHNANVATYLK